MYIAYGVQENAGPLQHPVYRHVDILLVFQWFIPGVAGVFAPQPGLVGDGLDGLYGNVTLLAGRKQGIEVFGVVGVLHGEIVIGEQHRVKVEAFQAAAVCGGNLQAMAGDADSLN